MILLLYIASLLLLNNIYVFSNEYKAEDPSRQEHIITADTDTSNQTQEEEQEDLIGHVKYTIGNNAYAFSAFLQTEVLLAKNLVFLNDNNPEDRIYFNQNVLDLKGTYSYSKENFKEPIVQVLYNMRTRTIWGANPLVLRTFLTLNSTPEVNGIFIPDHRHGIFLELLWVRQLWMEIDLSHLLCLPFCNRHTVTIGAFPFELGHAISLGALYLFTAPALSYYNETFIDQYSWAFKISGDLTPHYLAYDLYGTITENFSDSPLFTNLPVRAQQYGHCFDPTLGFGTFTYILASRLKWHFLGDQLKKHKIYFEPYIMFVYNPEIQVESPVESTLKLATVGLSGDFVVNNLEFSFEFGRNLGILSVRGIDRNVPTFDNKNGLLAIVNSQVIDIPTRSLALETVENQQLIECFPRSKQLNSKLISPTLLNSPVRFRDPYLVQLFGDFIIAECRYSIIPDELKISALFAYFSGDRLSDLTPTPVSTLEFNGFVGVKETYTGNFVTSILYRGYAVFPSLINFIVNQSSFQPPNGGLTNLIMTGFSLDFTTKKDCRNWHIFPNVLFYWNDEPALRPQLNNNKITSTEFDAYLGTEINTVLELNIRKDFRFFVIGALFIPGKQFDQRKNVPVGLEQTAFVEAQRNRVPLNPRVPLFGNNNAYILNFGLQYTF